MVREEEEGGHIRERGIIISFEQDSGKGGVIIKNILIDFLDLLNICFPFFSDQAYPKTQPQLTNYQALVPVVWQL
jgi:hypothetical protein